MFSREISSASRLASLAIGDELATSAYSLVDDESQQTITTEWAESTDQVSTDQLVVLFDPRGSVVAIPEYLQPEQLVRGALSRLRPKVGASTSPQLPPIRLLPATWLMDCIAEYTVLPPPKTV